MSPASPRADVPASAIGRALTRKSFASVHVDAAIVATSKDRRAERQAKHIEGRR